MPHCTATWCWLHIYPDRAAPWPSIRNPETDRLARQVAKLKRTGLAEAVCAALEDELEREQAGPSPVDIALEFVKWLRTEGDPTKAKPVDKAFYDALGGND
jgi:antitoxin VapB